MDDLIEELSASNGLLRIYYEKRPGTRDWRVL